MAQAKQYGGWYWQPEQSKALRWWGTDASGKDIYTEGDEPAKQQSVSSLSAGLSNLGGGSNLFGFDLPTLQTNFQDTYGKLQGAESNLQGYQTRRYEEEYGKAGLEGIKGEIDTLDTKIASEKQVRDESVSKVRKNPGYSAATITGETGEIQRMANATINNLIEERNTKAGTYNAKLGEITNKVTMETKDKESEVNNLRYNMQFLGGLLDTYQKTRTTELASQTETARWEKEFELKLYEAQTGRISASKTGGGSSSMQQVKDTWGNVIGYFDPATGETKYYETPQSEQTQQTTISDSQLRQNIRAGWKQGYTPDQMKTSLQGVVTDKGQNAAAIVDEEWNIKSAPGIGGFLGRLFRLGV